MNRKSRKTKNRKFIIILMILMLWFSIFKIGNTFASTESFSLTKVVISDKSNTANVNSISYEKNIISNDITFHQVGDSVTYKVTIENNEDENYTIKSISDDNKNEYITYEYDSYKGILWNAKTEKTFEIIAKYSNELMDLSKRNQDFSVTFTIVLEDIKGNIIETGATIEPSDENNTISSNKSITSTKNVSDTVSTNDSNVIVAKSTNPRTGDNVNYYVSISIISTLMIIIFSKNRTTVKSKKRNSSKYGKHSSNRFKFFSMFLALVIIIPTMVKASGNSFEIIFENKIQLMDKFKVTYVIDDKADEIIVKYKELAEIIVAPEKDGYTFDGWYLEDGTAFDFNTPIEEDTTIIAKYNIDEYKILYDLNGGQVSANPSIYTVEDEITLNNPEKVGYTFSGWTGSNGDDLQTRVTINKGSTGDKNYIANYSANQDTEYTVIHSIMNIDGETYTEKEREILHGATDTTVKPQTNVYVGFTAPDEEEITIKADGSSVLEYKYTRNKYSFTVENTEDIDSENSTENGKYYYETVVKAIAKNKDGYTFNQWSNGETNKKTEFILVEDTVINPIYDTIEYTITYHLDDGTVSGNPLAYTVESDDITLNKPEKEGYTFAGWTGTGLTSVTDEVKILKGSIGNREYTANYNIFKYNLNATDVDSNSTPNGSYDCGTHITLTAIDKEGYTFQKWSNNETTQTISFDLIEDTTINPIYKANTYKIAFNSNGGSGSMTDQTMTYGTSSKLKANTFTKTDYMFDNWNTKADGTGTSFEDQESVLNLATSGTITIYAIWKERVAVVDDYVQYNIAYTDMYSDTDYTFTNGWKLLDYTDNGDGTYSNVKLISTGVPAMLYYSYKSINNDWWESDLTKLNSFVNTLNTTIPNGGNYRLYSDYSNYPALKASAGLYESEKFYTIEYKYGSNYDTWGSEESDYLNRGYFKKITNNTKSYNSLTTGNVTGADLFKVDNAEVRILTLPEVNKMMNKTKTDWWGIMKDSTIKGFSTLNPVKGSYWLASPYYYYGGTDERFLVGISRTNANRYDNTITQEYYNGIRPIIILKSNVEFVDANKDGVWEIK